MLLNTDFTFGIYNTIGSQTVFVDVTPAVGINTPDGYGSPNPARSDISQIRLLISNYPDIIAELVLKASDTLVQYRMYEKIKGTPQVYDNKTISVSNIFIPPISGLVVLAGDEFQDLGTYVKYIPPGTFLPTTNTTQLILSIADMGLNSSNVTVPDVVFNNQYEDYGTILSVPFTTIDGLQYIVVGTSGTATFNGNIYRIGEMFYGDGTVFTTITGAAHIAPLVSSSEKTHVTTYNLEATAYQLNIVALTKQCAKNCPCSINEVYNLIEALKWQNYTNAVSFSKATDLIQKAQTTIQTLEKCFC